MARVRVTEAELARDLAAVLTQVQQGAEVVVERDNRPVAVITRPRLPGRRISECIALAKGFERKVGYAPVPDPDFASDVQEAVDANRDPFHPPAWD